MKPKKLFTLFIAAVMAFASLPVFAMKDVIPVKDGGEIIDSGCCGHDSYGNEIVFWSLTDDGVLTISGSGRMDDYQNQVYYIPGDDEAIPWLKYSEPYPEFWDTHDDNDDSYETRWFPSMRKVVVEEGVTHLGNYAFSGFAKMKEVELPSTLESIGEFAFGFCVELENIDIPMYVSRIESCAFMHCDSLESVRIPACCTWLNTWAFFYCDSLKTAVLPAVGYLGHTFGYALALEDVYYPGSKAQWEQVEGDRVIGNAKVHYYSDYNYIPYCSLSIKYKSWGYTGSQIKPTVTLRTASGTKLTKGKHYTVTYKNNVEYGTAQIIVTGIGKYYGTRTWTFNIRPAKVKGLTLVSYDGKNAVVKWTADPNTAEYVIKRGYNYVGTTTGNTFTVRNISPDKSHKIWVYPVSYGSDGTKYQGKGSYVIAQ